MILIPIKNREGKVDLYLNVDAIKIIKAQPASTWIELISDDGVNTIVTCESVDSLINRIKKAGAVVGSKPTL